MSTSTILTTFRQNLGASVKRQGRYDLDRKICNVGISVAIPVLALGSLLTGGLSGVPAVGGFLLLGAANKLNMMSWKDHMAQQADYWDKTVMPCFVKACQDGDVGTIKAVIKAGEDAGIICGKRVPTAQDLAKGVHAAYFKGQMPVLSFFLDRSEKDPILAKLVRYERLPEIVMSLKPEDFPPRQMPGQEGSYRILKATLAASIRAKNIPAMVRFLDHENGRLEKFAWENGGGTLNEYVGKMRTAVFNQVRQKHRIAPRP